jgi:hypothetical protein
MSVLRDRIIGVGVKQTDSKYVPNIGRVYSTGSDHTSLGLGEPGAINASGMPYPNQNTESTWMQPRETPLVRIGIYDGILSYEDGPIPDPNGLRIPQSAPGQWAQLYRAGRLYGR